MRTRHLLLLAGCCLFSTLIVAQKNINDKTFIGLDTAFARVLKDWHAAGFAVAVVEKNKVIYAKGFGYKDFENKKPVTPNTLFAIGSCTKAFTASLLGMLSKDDKVDFDKPVRTYLPELRFYNDEMNDKVTLRDMMSHRTGLPRHDFSWYFFSTQSRDSLLHRIQYMEPSAGLREKWQYNNFMFMLQGMVTEKLTGKSWEDNIREKIFAPLGMSASNVSIDELEKSPEAAIGYGVRKDTIIDKLDYYHIDAMGPAGSINSSVNDMAKWVTLWINGGKYNDKELIPGAYISQAMSSQMVVGGSLPDKEKPDLFLANYGFGWIISSYKGHYRVEHGGNIDGFSASTCIFPSDSVGIIVLSNQNGSTVPSIVRNLVADRVLGLKYFDWDSDLKRAANKEKFMNKGAAMVKLPSHKIGTKPSHELKDYEGLYNHKGYGTIEIVASKDSLFAMVGKKIWWLRHYNYDVFETIDKDPKKGIDTSDTGSKLMFNMTTMGDIDNLTVDFEPSLKPFVFNKTVKPKSLAKEELQKYVGTYLLSGVELKVYLKDDKTIFLSVPGQPEYELVAIDKDKFSIKILTGYTVQFNLNDKGDVTELLSIQPNGTFKATRKN